MNTGILRAAKRGDAALVAALLKANPSLIEARDKDGSTPLHCAAWKGHVDVVRVLLEHGADVNAENQNDHWGTTPLHAAAHGNQKAVAEVLLAHGANPALVNLNGRTPLEETAFHKSESVARLLEAKDG
jgi:ankyrin repeat protein